MLKGLSLRCAPSLLQRGVSVRGMLTTKGSQWGLSPGWNQRNYRELERESHSQVGGTEESQGCPSKTNLELAKQPFQRQNFLHGSELQNQL